MAGRTSGISTAHRQAIDNSLLNSGDIMFMDDNMAIDLPSPVASPFITDTTSSAQRDFAIPVSNSGTSAIPIKGPRRGSPLNSNNAPPASAPHRPGAGANGEFGYLKRHVRKTSMGTDRQVQTFYVSIIDTRCLC